MRATIQAEFTQHLTVLNATLALNSAIERTANVCIEALKNHHKILLFGNGGSAADAQHIAAELVGRYQRERKGLAAIALSTDTSALTAIGNDYGYEHIFSRQVEALASTGDILIGISTSGSSKNVIKALALGKKMRCPTIGLSGKDGGQMNGLCDINLVVPAVQTPRIQEMHILIGHILCCLIEQALGTK